MGPATSRVVGDRPSLAARARRGDLVGGQFTVAGVLPTLRSAGGDASRRAASFARLAWPAFIVLVATVRGTSPPATRLTGRRPGTSSFVKVAVVVAGAAALARQLVGSKRVIAVTGALAGHASLAILVLGAVLAGETTPSSRPSPVRLGSE